MRTGLTQLRALLPGLPRGCTRQRLVSDGERRSFLLYVPPGYDASRPAALVISIHGYAEWPAHQMHISRWNELAAQQGFLVAYPAGMRIPRRWRTQGDLPQDVDFISRMIDTLAGRYNLDPARIYANGLSNGGGMSFLLACRLSRRIAAIGSVSGAYLAPWEACQPARAVPAILFHGTADPIVPYHGGPSRAFNLPFPDIPTWVQTLAEHNGCGDPPVALPRQGDVSGLRYTGSAEVVFYTIAGGGHTWPGGEPLPRWIAGTTSQNIDATRVMWQFFQQHPLSGVT